MTFDWGVAMRALPGEIECGDNSTVVRHTGGAVIAVADGLGHGPEAAMASAAAIETIEANADASPDTLIRLCHERLRRTRGTALSVAAIDAAGNTLLWGGVGNVDGVLLSGADYPQTGTNKSRRDTILPQGGIVGYQLPTLRIRSCAVAAGDTLIFTTDGIVSSYLEGVVLHESPQTIADSLLHEYFRGTDDALVLVARLTEKVS